MNRSRLAAVGVSVALAAAVVLAAGESRAQTISLTEASIGRQVELRDQSQNPLWISQADCIADDVMTFPLLVSNYSGNGLGVWVGAGTDCSPVAARAAATATCWEVVSPAAPTSTTITVTAKVRDIVHNVPGAKPGSGTLEDCTKIGVSTAPQAITLYFMFIDSGSNLQGKGYAWPTKYDLWGPTAPTGIGVGQGDTFLKLSWAQTTDTDLTGYQFFCDPPRGSEGNYSTGYPFEGGTNTTPGPEPTEDASADASACDPDAEAGADGSCSDAQTTTSDASSEAATSGTCSTTKLIPGTLPDPTMLCGSASGSTSTEGKVTGLVNKFTYSIGVAAVDAVGNVGLLSAIVCEQPFPVDDFFKLYKEAGGEGGGSFCSVGSVGQGAGMVGFGVIAIAALARIARRRRENS